MGILVKDISNYEEFIGCLLHPLSFSNEGPYVLYTNIYNP